MFTKKLQDKWINKKRFQFDFDSTDEDDNGYSQPSHLKSFRKNSIKSAGDKRKTPITQEADDERYLSEFMCQPRKHFHADTPAKSLHNHNSYRPKPAQKKQFWMFHENGRTKGFSRFKFEDNLSEEPYIDENSGLEDRMNNNLEMYKPIDFNNESLLRLEEYLDFKVLMTDFWKEETMEDSHYIKDAKPYLQDSDREDFNIGSMTDKCHTAGYTENAYNLMSKVIQ